MKIKLTLPLVVFCIISACTEDTLDGKWDDNIHLSTKNVVFSAEEDSVVITTKGEWWWLAELRVGEQEFYNFDEIDVSDDNYTIKIDSITFERNNKTSIILKIGSNPTSLERNFGVVLQAGNYFDYISIVQVPN